MKGSANPDPKYWTRLMLNSLYINNRDIDSEVTILQRPTKTTAIHMNGTKIHSLILLCNCYPGLGYHGLDAV